MLGSGAATVHAEVRGAGGDRGCARCFSPCSSLYFDVWTRHHRINVVWDLVELVEGLADVEVVATLPGRTHHATRQAVLVLIIGSFQYL